MERDHAIVVGASMAGLLAARVLSDHFARVTILERDPLPQGPEVRKAVPQGAHTHPRSLAWHQFGAWKTRRPIGLTMSQQTRPRAGRLRRARRCVAPRRGRPGRSRAMRAPAVLPARSEHSRQPPSTSPSASSP